MTIIGGMTMHPLPTGGSRTIGQLEFRENEAGLSYGRTRRAARLARAQLAATAVLALALAGAGVVFAGRQLTGHHPDRVLFNLVDRTAIGVSAAAAGVVAGLVGVLAFWSLVDPGLSPLIENVLDRRTGRFRHGSRDVCGLGEIRQIWLCRDPKVLDSRSVEFGLAGRSHVIMPTLWSPLMPRTAAEACARLLADFLAVPVVEYDGLLRRPEPAADRPTTP